MQDIADIDIVRKDGTIRHLQALFKGNTLDGKNQYQTLYMILRPQTDRRNIRQMEYEAGRPPCVRITGKFLPRTADASIRNHILRVYTTMPRKT